MTFISNLGALALFTTQVLRTGLRTSGNLRPIWAQVILVCSRSIGTVILAGIFVGAILVIQFETMLARYDAQALLGGLNTSALIREVGPLIISFLLAGKIGAYTAAELGTMQVTEQMDAVRCLGKDPIQYFVLPRFMGIVLSSIILLVFGLSVSVLGSVGVATVLYGINPLQFLGSIPRFANQWTLVNGLFKSLVYGTIVASVACHRGYKTTGGAQGVGRAVTQASLYTNFYIVLANFLVSQWIDMIGALLHS